MNCDAQECRSLGHYRVTRSSRIDPEPIRCLTSRDVEQLSTAQPIAAPFLSRIQTNHRDHDRTQSISTHTQYQKPEPQLPPSTSPSLLFVHQHMIPTHENHSSIRPNRPDFHTCSPNQDHTQTFIAVCLLHPQVNHDLITQPTTRNPPSRACF